MEGHEHSRSNLRIGLLIAALAALLALMETGGKSAQTEAVNAEFVSLQSLGLLSSENSPDDDNPHGG
jgi:hypothetical protein